MPNDENPSILFQTVTPQLTDSKLLMLY